MEIYNIWHINFDLHQLENTLLEIINPDSQIWLFLLLSLALYSYLFSKYLFIRNSSFIIT